LDNMRDLSNDATIAFHPSPSFPFMGSRPNTDEALRTNAFVIVHSCPENPDDRYEPQESRR
ncbi:hypothetical protein NKI63_30345, partial [Mesorhizobium sp. M0410]|uniref:hypothetical protein n=1 Tax=Mesorhizobium sp. M0410 TaxID=2956943 RepID=UPI00333C3351